MKHALSDLLRRTVSRTLSRTGLGRATELDESGDDGNDDGSEDAAVPRWAPGERILDGDFVVHEILGAGGFGVVYRVSAEPSGRVNRRYIVTGMVYAAKRVRVPNRSVRDDLLKEIQNWRELPEHPNLLLYRFFREVGDDVVIFSEYATGGSLADAIAREEITDVRRALDLAIQAADGLAALHARGLVHQDVKPQNLLLRDDGSLALGDFGLASAVARGESGARRVGTAPVRGRTPAYAAPEHYSTEGFGPAGDLWSWAICVLELFNGAPLGRPGLDAPEALAAFRRDGPAWSSAPPMPETVAAALAHCFDPDPARRWSDAGEVADALIATYDETAGDPYVRRAADPVLPPDDGPTPTERDDRWFAARRRLLEAGDALFEAIDTAEEAGDQERLDALYDLLEVLPTDTTAMNPSVGRSPQSRAIHALRMLIAARDCLQALIDLGHQELREQLADLLAHLSDEREHQGDGSGARTAVRERSAVIEKLIADGRRDLLPDLLGSITRESTLLVDSGDTGTALTTLAAGVDRVGAVMDDPDLPAEVRAELVTRLFVAFGENGVTCLDAQQTDDALAWLDRAFEWSDQAKQQWQTEPDVRYLGWGRIQLANALDEAGRPAEAVDAYDAAVVLLEQVPGVEQELSSALLNKGITLMRQGELDRAEEAVRRALEMREADEDALGWHPRHDLAFARLTFAQLLRRRQLFAEAEASADAALALWRQLVEQEGHLHLGQYQYLAMTEAAAAGAEIVDDT